MTTPIRTALALLLLVSGTSASSAYAQEEFVPCRRFLHQIECVTVPLASVAADIEAKQFRKTGNGLGKVYLIRPGTMGPKQKTDIFLDGKRVASLAPMTYLVMEMRAGMHTVGANSDSTTSLSFEVTADNNTFIKEQLYQFFNSEKIVFEIDDQKAGQTDVLKSALISTGALSDPTP